LNANQTAGRRSEVDRIVADFHARWVEAGKPPSPRIISMTTEGFPVIIDTSAIVAIL
jgi:hypothetical protein